MYIHTYTCSVLQFVKSQYWEIPVSHFIDHRCAVFDNEEENSLHHTEEHKQYQGAHMRVATVECVRVFWWMYVVCMYV